MISSRIKNGEIDEILVKLYGDENVSLQKQRYLDAIDEFKKLYGDGEIEIFSAPGRSEIGGNHTDHQQGKVLAAAIDLDAIAITKKTDDNKITIKSKGYDEFSVDLDDLEICESRFGSSPALVRGIAACFKESGLKIGGFKAYTTNNVLSGSGLSSSAAFEILIGTVLSGLYNENSIDPVFLARVGQLAENKYFGKPCGLLDQMACSVGGICNIDFADKNDPKIKKLEVDFGDYGHALCIVDTKGSHADLTDEYAAVPAEMKEVAGFFGKSILGEVSKKDFYENITKIRETTSDRAVLRAIHWYSENERVDGEVAALSAGDFTEFKNIVKASGDSSFKYLQNVFAAKKVTEQGVSFGLAMSDEILKGRGVSRVHGGGFAGTIQAFVPLELVDEYRAEMERVFGEGACYVLKIRPVGGVKII